MKISKELRQEDLDNLLYEEINNMTGRLQKIGINENVYGKTLVEIKYILGDYKCVEDKIETRYDLIKMVKDATKEKENTERGSYAYQMGEWALYSKFDTQLAIRCYKMGIKKNNKDSYFRLGTIYKNVEGYLEQSKEYLQKALELGSREMQYEMGRDYEEGNDVRKNLKYAIEWYSKSADQGFSKAQFKLGYMYENKLGTEQDYVEAAKWYEKCCKTIEQNYIEVQKWPISKPNTDFRQPYYRLGQMFEKGLGVEQDYLKAIELYEIIAWPLMPWHRDQFSSEIEKRIVEIVKVNNVDYDYEEKIELFDKKYNNPF